MLRSTGRLVTMAWLFDNGYSKSDCDPLAQVADKARQSLGSMLEAAEASVGTLGTAIDAVAAAAAALKENRQMAAARIAKFVEDATAVATGAVRARGAALEADLAHYFEERETVLQLQLSALDGQRGAQAAALATGRQALSKSDAELFEANGQVAQ